MWIHAHITQKIPVRFLRTSQENWAFKMINGELYIREEWSSRRMILSPSPHPIPFPYLFGSKGTEEAHNDYT